MIRLLLDQGLPRSATILLQQRGIDAIHVGDIGMSAASDMEILDKARCDNRIVVTLDADFHSLLAVNALSSPSVLRIRIEGLNGDGLCTLLCRVFELCGDDLAIGAVVSAQINRIGVKLLPIDKSTAKS